VEKSAYEEFGHFRANERTRTRGLYYVYVRTEKQYIAGITHLLMLTSSVDGLKKKCNTKIGQMFWLLL